MVYNYRSLISHHVPSLSFAFNEFTFRDIFAMSIITADLLCRVALVRVDISSKRKFRYVDLSLHYNWNTAKNQQESVYGSYYVVIIAN